MAELVPGDPIRTVTNVVKGAVDKIHDLVDGTDHGPLATVESIAGTPVTSMTTTFARLARIARSSCSVS